MNNENKGLILDTLKGATGIIDEVTFYYVSAGNVLLWSLKPTITWNAAADGKLTMSGTIDFENTSGAAITVSGFALLNSNATTLTYRDDSVTYQSLSGGAVLLEVGEIIRITTMEYTVD